MSSKIAYFDFVEDLAKNRKDQIVFNSGHFHASIIMSRIFRYSQKDVRIFCGGFAGSVSSSTDYLEELENFLTRPNTKLKILSEKSSCEGTGIYSLLKKYVKTGKVEAKTTTARFNVGGKTVHFTVGDDHMYRLETDIENFKAQANFNAETSAAALTDAFERVFSSTVPGQVQSVSF